MTSLLVLWPLVGIVGSIVGGAGYGFFVPLMATFEAVGEGRSNKFSHCITVCLLILMLALLFFKICTLLMKFNFFP